MPHPADMLFSTAPTIARRESEPVIEPALLISFVACYVLLLPSELPANEK